jgi:hypothetical protein
VQHPDGQIRGVHDWCAGMHVLEEARVVRRQEKVFREYSYAKGDLRDIYRTELGCCRNRNDRLHVETSTGIVDKGSVPRFNCQVDFAL